jgi:enamine deaminase RidA (YjgF/YER057c/UK114 family)
MRLKTGCFRAIQVREVSMYASRLCIAGLLLFLPVPLNAQGLRYINPPTLAKPTGYTHVVVAPDGRTVYIAGQVALDSTGQLVGSGDFRRQAEQVIRNLQRALASVGGTLDDVAKTTTFITDLKYLPALREVRSRYLSAQRPPASTLLVVSSLARPEYLIEVEAIAVLSTVVRHTAD